MASNLSRGKNTCVVFIPMYPNCIKYDTPAGRLRRSQAIPCALGGMAGRGTMPVLADLASTMLLQGALGAQGQVATSEKDPLSSVILCEDTFPFLEEQGPSHWRENL